MKTKWWNEDWLLYLQFLETDLEKLCSVSLHSELCRLGLLVPSTATLSVSEHKFEHEVLNVSNNSFRSLGEERVTLVGVLDSHDYEGAQSKGREDYF